MLRYFRIGLTLFVICYLGLTFAGCGGVKVKPAGLEKIGAPEWVYKGGGAFKEDKGRVLYGVGSSSGVRNKTLATSAADNRARNEIAKTLEVFVSSLMRDYAASTTAGDFKNTAEEQHIEQAVKTVTSMTLTGAEIVDHWEDSRNGDIYSLARVDLESFKNNLEKMETLNEKVREFVKERADKLQDDLSKEEERVKSQQ